jgi:SPP1 gp7 family putative phage head morphogenesis protein
MKAVMVMKNNTYWTRRMEILEAAQLQKGQAYYATLEKQFREASANIEKEISKWYQRFAINNNISMAEAKKLLNTRELAEFKWDVEEYIKFGEKNAVNQLWMKQLENASAKVHISRLEALRLQMQQQVEVLYGNYTDGFDKLMRGIYSDGYYHTAWEIQKGFNIGWDLHDLNSNQLDKILAKPWTTDGKTFSDRIWTNKQQLIGTLQTHLIQSVITGQAPDKVIKSIAEDFRVDRNKAGRLVMTESAAFASASQRDAFTALDVERFEIVATLDNRTSQICQNLDGHVFDMKNFEVGVTAPPFHAWCRTTTVPHFEDDYGERAARGADGKTYYIPSNMKYAEWKKTFVDGGSKDGLKELDKNGKIKGTTLEEIQNNITSIAGFKKTTANLNGVELEVAQGIEESYSNIMNRYPQLKGEFYGLGVNEKGANTYASCYVYNGSINVNPSFYGKLSKITESYDADVKLNWHPQGTDWKSIITHEIGHAVDGYLTRNGHGEVTTSYNVKNASTKMRKQVLKELKLAKNDISAHVSRYASKNDAEFFAECFAEYIDSDEPRLMAKKFGEILEEWMKGLVK